MTEIRLLACYGVQICSVFLLIISSSAYAVVEHISDGVVDQISLRINDAIYD